MESIDKTKGSWYGEEPCQEQSSTTLGRICGAGSEILNGMDLTGTSAEESGFANAGCRSRIFFLTWGVSHPENTALIESITTETTSPATVDGRLKSSRPVTERTSQGDKPSGGCGQNTGLRTQEHASYAVESSTLRHPNFTRLRPVALNVDESAPDEPSSND
jgi:hypothetical protein